jgi:hypothetical protein
MDPKLVDSVLEVYEVCLDRFRTMQQILDVVQFLGQEMMNKLKDDKRADKPQVLCPCGDFLRTSFHAALHHDFPQLLFPRNYNVSNPVGQKTSDQHFDPVRQGV